MWDTFERWFFRALFVLGLITLVLLTVSIFSTFGFGIVSCFVIFVDLAFLFLSALAAETARIQRK